MAHSSAARCMRIAIQRRLTTLFIIFITISALNNIQVAAQGTYGYTLVIASHKTGSSFLDKIYDTVGKKLNVCFVHLDLLKNNEAESAASLRKMCPNGGILFGRELPKIPSQRKMISAMKAVAGDNCRAVFQIRNPYDVAVSQFQSFTQNHVIPDKFTQAEKEDIIQKRLVEHALGVDVYAIKHFPEILHRLSMTRAFATLMTRAKVEVMMSKYEEMTVTPDEWGVELAKFLKLEPQTEAYKGLMKLAAQEHEVKPDDKTHTAYFLPGAHLKLLNKTTLDYLY